MNYVGLLFSILIILPSCDDNKVGNDKELIDVLSKLEVYQKADRVAPKCSDIDALETNGKYSSQLKEYTGKIKVCNSQGNIVTLYTLKNGKHEGYFYTYDDSGLLISKSYYQNDQKHGDYTSLDESGRILIKAKFKNNVLIQCDGPLCEEFENMLN